MSDAEIASLKAERAALLLAAFDAVACLSELGAGPAEGPPLIEALDT